MIEAALTPRGPYALRLSARLAGDATRRLRDDELTAVFEVEGRIEQARARQRPDGVVLVRADSEDALAQLRFVLGLDDDHSPFLREFARDPLLRQAIPHLRGLRPIRLATVTHALLRALCGQLIQARRAREIERAVIRAATPRHDETGLRAPPSAALLRRFSPVELRALGLGMRRGAALARLCRAGGLESLRGVSTHVAADRLERERGLGPWSAGVVCLEGLGRFERGLVGDLGLVKLLSALRGRWVEPWETAELLEPYGDWAGLASVYLLAGSSRGLLGVPPLRSAA